MHDYTGTDTYPATISLIDDTDTPVAANFNSEAEGLANRTTYLKNRLGAYYIVQTWENNFATAFSDSATFTGTTFNAALSYTALTVGLANLAGNDFFTFELSGTLHVVAASSSAYACEMALTVSANGAGFAAVTGSVAAYQDVNSVAAPTDYYIPFTLTGTKAITSTVADFKVGVMGFVGNVTTSPSVSFAGPWHVRATQYRSTT